jgi:hypothetical protein
VAAQVIDDGESLSLRVDPPATTGRFDAVVTLHYNDARIPDFPVKVSGIVRE